MQTVQPANEYNQGVYTPSSRSDVMPHGTSEPRNQTRARGRDGEREEKGAGDRNPGMSLSRATDRQLSHLLQDALDLRVELPRGVVVPHAVVKVALHARELLVALLGELALHPYHRLEARVKVRHALLEQDRDFAHELVVEQVEDLFGLVEFLLRLCDHAPKHIRCPVLRPPEGLRWKGRTDLGKPCGVLARLFSHLAHFASRSVIIEELERPHAARCDREGAHHGTSTGAAHLLIPFRDVLVYRWEVRVDLAEWI